MSEVEEFLSAAEEQEIVSAILEAENNTSGEIRVHIESSCNQDHYKRAQQLFHQLKMDNTRERNGVLLYVAVKDHKFVILGDKGIDKVVPDDFWDTTRDIIQEHFKKGQFKQGIVEGILMAGNELKVHFPWKSDDTNELSDEISKA
ncbi:MAG: TPM domain-containing protein [Flavobacteriaceae bacterium]